MNRIANRAVCATLTAAASVGLMALALPTNALAAGAVAATPAIAAIVPAVARG